MQKGVAVPFIIALLLGVAVIALIGFWIFRTGGKFSGEAIETQCKGEVIKYCAGSPTGDAHGSLSQECNVLTGLETNCANLIK